MKINLLCQFYSKTAALLIIIVCDCPLVCYSTGLTEKKPCKAIHEKECVILCRDRSSESADGVGELKEILKAEGKKFKTCSLILKRYNHTDPTWDEINPDDDPQIADLKIFHSALDVNRVSLKILRNLRGLALKNTTTSSLRLEVFRRLPKLQKLRIRRPNLIKWADKGFLQNLSVETLQVQGIDLNQSKTLEFFRNLTDGREIPTVRELDWSHNNFGNFPKGLLAPFPNLNLLILTNSSISTFDDGTFARGSIKNIFINHNKIEKLPEKIFRPLVENTSFVSLEGNNLTCDCETKWLQNLIKRRKHSQHIQINCARPAGTEFLDPGMCPDGKSKDSKEVPTVYCTPRENSEIAHDYNSVRFFPMFGATSDVFTITRDEPEMIEITIPDMIAVEQVFLWYGDYADTTSPKFNCLKILREKFTIHVTPDANYLICLATIREYLHDTFNCLPFKTKPPYENQTWLPKKSISLTIISVFVAFLFALATGALILYLSVRKNPSLIRRSKRVIEVKTHDKAKVLIMPRGYETQADASRPVLARPRLPLEPSRSRLSCDTISTVSYVSAHQPTQLEILTYRLNRLRELFQRNNNNNNNLPPPVPRMSRAVERPISQRLPPDVDLLLEYEWYTITTTTTTQV